jgi:hypothetical protein
VNLCRAYRHSGRDREALAPVLRAAELRPDLAAYANLSDVAVRRVKRGRRIWGIRRIA